jgi:Raf kinase inhibitor-like YbhB/YbcL family protein
VGPSGTKTYALIVDDPDAPDGTFVHWVLFNLTAPALAEGTRDGTPGANDFGKRGYGGPCPPPGAPHHYRFHVFAVDRSLAGLGSSITAEALRAALSGHVLAEGELVGTFQR